MGFRLYCRAEDALGGRVLDRPSYGKLVFSPRPTLSRASFLPLLLDLNTLARHEAYFRDTSVVHACGRSERCTRLANIHGNFLVRGELEGILPITLAELNTHGFTSIALVSKIRCLHSTASYSK